MKSVFSKSYSVKVIFDYSNFFYKNWEGWMFRYNKKWYLVFPRNYNEKSVRIIKLKDTMGYTKYFDIYDISGMSIENRKIRFKYTQLNWISEELMHKANKFIIKNLDILKVTKIK